MVFCSTNKYSVKLTAAPDRVSGDGRCALFVFGPLFRGCSLVVQGVAKVGVRRNGVTREYSEHSTTFFIFFIKNAYFDIFLNIFTYKMIIMSHHLLDHYATFITACILT